MSVEDTGKVEDHDEKKKKQAADACQAHQRNFEGAFSENSGPLMVENGRRLIRSQKLL